jgi:hypothetical protein
MTESPRPHLHTAAFAALLAHEPSKSEVSRRSGQRLPNLRGLELGTRPGTQQALRDGLAEALGVDPLAITCWCDRPHNRCRSVPGDTT